MLDKIRKPGRAKGLFATIVFGAICFVFVFLGMGYDQFGMTTGGPAAMVNKEPIPYSDFRESFARLRNQNQKYIDQMPAARRQSMLDNMRQQALGYLINSAVLRQSARQLGIRSSDTEVRDFIVSIPVFRKDDKFQRSHYDNYLTNRGISAEKFESEIRRDLARDRIRSYFEKSVQGWGVEDNLEEKITNLKLNLSFAQIKNVELEKNLSVPPSRVQTFLENEENKEKISDYYQANMSKYQTKEQVKARHILIKATEDKDSQDSALEKINGIKSEATPENFSDLASKHSDDPGSKAKGGSLGFFGRGRMVPEFEQSAFTLPPGQISEPIKTNFGFHLILVDEKKEASTRALDEVKISIANELLKGTETERKKSELSEHLKSGSTAGVNSWLKKHNIKLQETGEFPLNTNFTPKLGNNDGVVEAALNTKKEGVFADQIILSNGQSYIVKIKDLKVEASKEEKGKDMPKEFSSKDRVTNDIFTSWAQQQIESAQIVRNQSVLNIN